MKFREIILKSGKKILAGKDAEKNDELVKMFKGKENVIMHTALPGSPFCVIDDLKFSRRDIKETAVFCARRSQDWRDNKKDVKVHVFSGKDVYKRKGMKTGTWGIKRNPKVIKVKRREILKLKQETI